MYCRSKTKSLWNKGWLFWRQVKLVWQWTHLMPKPQKRASSFNGLQKPFVGYYMNLHHELNYCGNIFHSLVMRITQWGFCRNALCCICDVFDYDVYLYHNVLLWVHYVMKWSQIEFAFAEDVMARCNRVVDFKILFVLPEIKTAKWLSYFSLIVGLH